MRERVRSGDAEVLARWAVSELSETLGFDAAWYGWAQISQDGVEVHASASLHLPDTYFETWQTMSKQDLLAAQILENPEAPAAYSRTGSNQNDGMVFLADTFGFSEIATAMHTRPGRICKWDLLKIVFCSNKFENPLHFLCIKTNQLMDRFVFFFAYICLMDKPFSILPRILYNCLFLCSQ